jgi:hypothetical protein
VEGELAALDGQGPVFVIDPAGPAAVRAGLRGAEGLGLLFQEGAEGALGQATSGGRGDLLHGHQVDRAVWARLAEGTAGDDFPPLGRQGVDLLQSLRRGLAM